MSASPGADTIDGGEDRDLVDYADFFVTKFGPIFTSDAVDVDLEREVQFGGMAEGDVLISIERMRGRHVDFHRACHRLSVHRRVDRQRRREHAGWRGRQRFPARWARQRHLRGRQRGGFGRRTGRQRPRRGPRQRQLRADGGRRRRDIAHDQRQRVFTAINLTGNVAGNQIVGNNGANTLDGGGGNDQLVGRGGNDVYIVDSASDTVAENGGQGFDWSLPARAIRSRPAPISSF
jgi:Ca2+-binding RTX toxin-like protein